MDLTIEWAILFYTLDNLGEVTTTDTAYRTEDKSMMSPIQSPDLSCSDFPPSPPR